MGSKIITLILGIIIFVPAFTGLYRHHGFHKVRIALADSSTGTVPWEGTRRGGECSKSA